ncbi:hypothetical protein BJ912DRAFT_230469 [Pholiota molesta]|nr:hypothetical protein BJ912DRAFT_230469 [Pholiota molesta]
MPVLLSLSPRLIDKILYELPPRDLAKCMLLNKLIFTLIRRSIRLKYKLALMRVGAEDNKFSTRSIDVKLKSLLDSQRAWIWLNPVLDYGLTMTLPVGAGTDVSLNGGMLYGATLRTDDYDLVHLVQLTTSSDSDPSRPLNYSYQRAWEPHASYSSMWLAYTASLYEHGLLAEVHSEWVGDEGYATTFKISIYLHQYERPTAQSREDRSHRIYVMDCPIQQPSISLEMVGKHIAIIVGTPEDDEDTGRDHIFVYDFISRVLVMAFRAPGRTYLSVVFLDENFILLPNTQEGGLDIFRIPWQPKFEPIAPLVSLDLPILQAMFAYRSIVCTANPNPFSASSYAEMYRRSSQRPGESHRHTLHPERGHFKRAEESLCLFTVRVETAQTPQNARSQLMEEITFVVHRSELLKIVAEYEKQPSPTNHPHSHSSPPHRADHHSRPIQDLLLPLTSSFRMNLETAHLQFEASSGDLFWNMPPTPHPVSWENWGPSITRWFANYGMGRPGMGRAHLTKAWGERCVRLAPRLPPKYNPLHGSLYMVIDFCRTNRNIARRANAHIVTQRNARNLPRLFSETVSHPVYGEVLRTRWELVDFLLPNSTVVMEAPTYLISKVFLHPVISTLPYYCRVSEEVVDWDRILIDDQMIVGIRQTPNVPHGSVEVRFFG